MNLINILAGISSFLLLLFSMHLFLVKTGNLFLNKLLAFFFISRFFENLIYILIFSEQLVYVPYILKLFSPLSFIAPSLFYLYIDGFLRDKFSFEKRDLIHFIPLIFSLIDVLPSFFYYASDISIIASQIIASKTFLYKERIGFLSGVEIFYIRQGLYLFYFLLIGRLIFKTKIIQRADWKPIQNRWVVFVSVSMFLLQLSRIAVAFFTDKSQSTSFLFLPITGVLSAILIVLVVLFLLYNPRILYGFIFIGKESVLQTENTAIINEVVQPDKISRKSELFNNVQRDAYISTIIKYMAEEKPYLNPDFRIVQIADKLNIPVHHCSYILNFELNKNFRDWINGYRIEYFIQQFQLKSDRMTIEALAFESGFSTPATFYNAFKKEKGVSPTVFFKEIMS